MRGSTSTSKGRPTRADKVKERKAFIQRFSSNASKAKQATSRKKLLDKLELDEIPRTSRKFPYIHFDPARAVGKQILTLKDVSKSIDGVKVLDRVNLVINPDEKVAFVGPDGVARSALFDIIAGVEKPDEGEVVWGTTITHSYFPKDNGPFFEDEINMVDWLRQFSEDQSESFVRGFLGRMLFAGEESKKKVSVLSGGERVRCMLARMMLSGANTLVLDEPTNHLDLESIEALNDGLIRYSEVVLFASHDHQFVQTIANRIIEITPGGIIDKMTNFDAYIEAPDIIELRKKYYGDEYRPF